MNGAARSSASSMNAVGRGPRQHNSRVTFDDELKQEKISDASWVDNLLGLATAGIASVCLCGLLTMLCVLFVTVRPFSETMYRRLGAQMGLGSFLDALALLLPNMKICVTGDSDIPSLVGTSMLISNHVCVADWWAILMLGRCVGLRGAVKVFLRNEYLNIKMDTPDTENNRNGSSSTAVTTTSTSTSALLQSAQRPAENGNHGGGSDRKHASPDLSLMAKLLHQLLEFPLINGEDYAVDRHRLFPLLRSFAQNANAGAPVHLAFFPESWSLHNGANRQTLLAKSNEFAKKEGRPQLKHLLLPRTRGFNSCLECLRESSPVVYDVTLVCTLINTVSLMRLSDGNNTLTSIALFAWQAYKGYNGSLPPSMELSMTSLWQLLRRRFPKEMHIRFV